ncbi:MAG: ABC transporter ATP-binding protein [Nocardioides sp.]
MTEVATGPGRERVDRPDPTGPPAVESWGLTKTFGRTRALDGIDLRVPRNVVFGYLGPNGAGKTTTIRILTGLMRPTAGRAEVLGRDVVADREAAQRLIGYLPGDFVAFPDLTGEQYLRYLAHLRGGVDWSVVEDLVERLGAELNRRIGALSRGNRQKLGIVQTFMHEPELLVLDEPTVGLDPLVQREFLQLVREARAGGGTVFLSSHVLSEVEAVADLVGIVRDGRLVVTDAVAHLQQQAMRRIDLVFATTPPADALRSAAGVREVTVRDHTAHVSVAGSTADLFRAAAPFGIKNAVTHEADLEEIFLGWYRDGGVRSC